MIYLVRRKSFSTVLKYMKRATEVVVSQLTTSNPSLEQLAMEK